MELPKRKPNRLPCFDYSTPGMYFVTICTEARKNTLCTIVGDGFPVPKYPGKIAEQWILRISEKYPNSRVEKYVVMPNHIHMLIHIDLDPGTGNPSPTLGNIVGWYKYQVTREINSHCHTTGIHFFQRSYHDHVIRGEKDYQKIWQYIDNNPASWEEDCFYKEEAL